MILEICSCKVSTLQDILKLALQNKKLLQETLDPQKVTNICWLSTIKWYWFAKPFLQNTLDISERTVRTALSKITSTATVELDKKGGRKSKNFINLDQKKNKLAGRNINSFPFVESHYCRASSSKNYLHHDLS